MKPIPKVLLIHDASLQSVTGKDNWGNETLSDVTSLKYVRFEPSTKYVKDKQNNEVQLAAVMFYDCKNSRPKGQTFTDNQVVTFGGEGYQIKLVEPLYDGRRLHHYEVGVIRRA